jgi:nucleoid-associated protein YgaU
MSLISFIKDAGEKLFGGKDAAAAPPAATVAATSAPTADKVADLNAAAGAAIKKYIDAQQLKADNLQVAFDGASHTVTVSGVAADQATKEKIVLCCGNVASVEKVEDQMTVSQPASTASKFHTVVSGDTLSKIAQKEYGNASLYNKIFEANRPMLSNPDKIYPGQVLRIPE